MILQKLIQGEAGQIQETAQIRVRPQVLTESFKG